MPESPWTDTTVMPWGKYSGKKLSELPPDYLLWLFEQRWIKDWPGLYAYLKKNEDLLLEEKRERDGNRDDGDPKTWDEYKNYR